MINTNLSSNLLVVEADRALAKYNAAQREEDPIAISLARCELAEKYGELKVARQNEAAQKLMKAALARPFVIGGH